MLSRFSFRLHASLGQDAATEIRGSISRRASKRDPMPLSALQQHVYDECEGRPPPNMFLWPFPQPTFTCRPRPPQLRRGVWSPPRRGVCALQPCSCRFPLCVSTHLCCQVPPGSLPPLSLPRSATPVFLRAGSAAAAVRDASGRVLVWGSVWEAVSVWSASLYEGVSWRRVR